MRFARVLRCCTPGGDYFYRITLIGVPAIPRCGLPDSCLQAQAALTDAAAADGDSAGPVVAMGTALDGASGGGTLAANAPPQIVGELIKPRGCYICKCKFRDVHHFYDM